MYDLLGHFLLFDYCGFATKAIRKRQKERRGIKSRLYNYLPNNDASRVVSHYRVVSHCCIISHIIVSPLMVKKKPPYYGCPIDAR